MMNGYHIEAMGSLTKKEVLAYLAAQGFTTDQLDDLLEEANKRVIEAEDRLEELYRLPAQRDPYTGIYEDSDAYYDLRQQADALADLANTIEEYQMALEEQRQYA